MQGLSGRLSKKTASLEFKRQITIVGASDTGILLAEKLGRENQNVVLIDREEDFLRELNEEVDVLSLAGNPLGIETLKAVGVGEGTRLIAVSDSDELNLLMLFLGESLGVKEGYALVKNQEHYISFLPRAARSRGKLNLINAWELVTQELERRANLKFRLLYSDEKQKSALAAVEFLPRHPLLGQQVSSIKVGNRSRVLQTVRKGKWLIAEGNSRLEAGDIFIIYIDLSEQDRVMRRWFNYENTAKVMIGGDGLIQAVKSHWPGFFKGLVCIERELSKCQQLLKITGHSLVLRGDALDISLLKEAGIEDAALFLAASENDEINLLASLLARSFGVKEVLTILRKRQHTGMLERLNLEGIISLPQLIVEHLTSRINPLKPRSSLERLSVEIAHSPAAESLNLAFKAGMLVPVNGKGLSEGEEVLSLSLR